MTSAVLYFGIPLSPSEVTYVFPEEELLQDPEAFRNLHGIYAFRFRNGSAGLSLSPPVIGESVSMGALPVRPSNTRKLHIFLRRNLSEGRIRELIGRLSWHMTVI